MKNEQTDRMILAAAGKQVPVRVEDDYPHPVRMAMQSVQAAPGIRIPQTDGLFLTPTRECKVTRTERNSHHTMTMVLH